MRGYIKSLLFAAICAVSFSSEAQVVCPNADLTNGTTADATQVMGWLDCKAPMYSPIFSGNVGIGMTSPISPLTVQSANGGSDRTVATFSNTYTGSGESTSVALLNDGVTGDVSVFGPDYGPSLYNNKTLLESYNNPVGLNGGGASGSISLITASVERLHIDSSGNVGIGTSSPGQILDVAGTIRQSGCTTAGTLAVDSSGDIICSSDARLKNIRGRYIGGLDEIARIQPVLFTYKPTKQNPNETFVHAGFIAQEIKAVIPQASALQRDGYYSLDTTAILAASVNAIKELDRRLKEKGAQIDRLEKQIAQNAALISRLEKLERRERFKTASR